MPLCNDSRHGVKYIEMYLNTNTNTFLLVKYKYKLYIHLSMYFNTNTFESISNTTTFQIKRTNSLFSLFYSDTHIAIIIFYLFI